jgi:ADP-heptose:LPS heptosyltransferase
MNGPPKKIPEKILVIKLGALGDFILALGAMEAIRKHHKGARITLLTTRPFLDIAQRSGYFDDILIDARPKFYDVGQWLFLFRAFNKGGFTRVYDLQMNDRTAIYYRLFMNKPEWSGVIPGAPLFCPAPGLKKLHAFDRHREVLSVAGIDVQLPDISWMKADVSLLGAKKPYVLLIPGAAAHRPAKRWPANQYGALALKLAKQGRQPVILGGEAESEAVARIARTCPGALNLCGRTTLYDIAALAREAEAALGNDTGPTHIAAAAGCPTVALFCLSESNPELSRPVGKSVRAIAADALEDVSVKTVWDMLGLDG